MLSTNTAGIVDCSSAAAILSGNMGSMLYVIRGPRYLLCTQNTVT